MDYQLLPVSLTLNDHELP